MKGITKLTKREAAAILLRYFRVEMSMTVKKAILQAALAVEIEKAPEQIANVVVEDEVEIEVENDASEEEEEEADAEEEDEAEEQDVDEEEEADAEEEDDAEEQEEEQDRGPRRGTI